MPAAHVAIVGAGIGGLSLAAALQQHEISATVLEQAPAMETIGSGLTLGSGALSTLDRLGIGETIRERCGHASRRTIRASDGRVLRSTPWTGAVIHRADLQSALLELVDMSRICLGSRVVTVRDADTHISAVIDEDRECVARVLVAADGLNSTIRTQLFTGAQPRPTGMTALRGIATIPVETPHEFSETWGCGQRFGLQPLSDTHVYWYATTNGLDDAFEDPARAAEWLTSAFRTWHDPIPDVIQSTPADSLLATDIYDLGPLRTWIAGRVALLGDAAHAMTPDLGIGAAEAMNDAVSLAQSIHAYGERDGLEAYERTRRRAANSHVSRARRTTRIRQVERPLLCKIRNILVRARHEVDRLLARIPQPTIRRQR